MFDVAHARVLFADRRSFLGGLLSVGAVAGCCFFPRGGGPRLGAQLFSVRDVLAKRGYVATFRALRSFGYDGVELYSGAPVCSPKEMARFLEDEGLVACGVHIGPEDLTKERLGRVIEEGLAFGNTHFVVAWSVIRGETVVKRRDGWTALADQLSTAADMAASYGCTIGYHNHKKEFERQFPSLDGSKRCGWEILYDRASPRVKTEMDVGWATDAGEDVSAWFARYPGRALTIHAKEVSPGRALGDVPNGRRGVDWATVGRVARADGTEWAIVECEAEPANLGLMRDSAAFLAANRYFS